MDALEYYTIDKSSWGDGPWTSEPDKMQWRDDATGFPCLIVRGPSGALCGYVGVHAGHRLHGIGYNECILGEACPEKKPNEDWHCCDHRPESFLAAHGGLTFAAGCGHGDDPAKGVCHIPAAGDPDDVWWFGFDCAHAGDFCPGSDARYREIVSAEKFAEHEQVLGLGRPTGWGGNIEYRDISYVRAEVASLAQGIEAQRAETHSGSVEDESLVGNADAPQVHAPNGGTP